MKVSFIGNNFQKTGGESHKVGELSGIVIFELEAYLEPKILQAMN